MPAPFTTFPIPTVLLSTGSSSQAGIVQVDGNTIIAVGGIITARRSQRSITGAGNLPLVASDQILNINSGLDLAPIVPLASGRQGLPLTFKNLPGSHTQTITSTSPDTFDGAASLALVGGASLTLMPYNDGVNAGYAIE